MFSSCSSCCYEIEYIKSFSFIHFECEYKTNSNNLFNISFLFHSNLTKEMTNFFISKRIFHWKKTSKKQTHIYMIWGFNSKQKLYFLAPNIKPYFIYFFFISYFYIFNIFYSFQFLFANAIFPWNWIFNFYYQINHLKYHITKSRK